MFPFPLPLTALVIHISEKEMTSFSQTDSPLSKNHSLFSKTFLSLSFLLHIYRGLNATTSQSSNFPSKISSNSFHHLPNHILQNVLKFSPMCGFKLPKKCANFPSSWTPPLGTSSNSEKPSFRVPSSKPYQKTTKTKSYTFSCQSTI